MTLREQILVALVLRLGALNVEVPGLEIRRNPRHAITKAPTLVIREGAHTAETDQNVFTRYVLSLEIQGFVDAAEDADLGPAINDLYGRVMAVLLTEPSFGGLALDTREREFSVDIATMPGLSEPAGWFSLGIEIEFLTRAEDPALPAP